MRLSPLLLSAALIVGCMPTNPDLTPPVDGSDEAADVREEAVVIDWEMTEEAPGAFDQPNFSLALVLSGATEDRIELGSYAGSFVDGRESPVVTEADALLTGASWWAGAGDEFKVIRTAAGLSVMHRIVEEEVELGDYSPLETVLLEPDTAVTAK